MSFGSGEFGSSLYGGKTSLFQVVSASAINSSTVVLTFSEPPDFDDPGTTNPSNYYIDVVGPGAPLGTPSLVQSDPDPNSVRLITPPQQSVQYKVTVSNVDSDSSGDTVDLEANSAVFTGLGSSALGFHAAVIRPDGINLAFILPMSVDANLLSPSSYVVAEVSGLVLPVSSVVSTSATRAVLNLVSGMRPSVPHTVRVLPYVQTQEGGSVLPDTRVVVWTPRVRSTKVSFALFTKEVRAPDTSERRVDESLGIRETLAVVTEPYFGQTFEDSSNLTENLTVFSSNDTEIVQVTSSTSSTSQYHIRVRGSADTRPTLDVSLVEKVKLHEALDVSSGETGLDPNIAALFGNPQGLVFFSPSLITGGAPSSSIQVDEVKVCTTAYDSYKLPQPIDPQPFFTFSPLSPPSLLNSPGMTLFADFYRLGEAKHTLHDARVETAPPPSDIGASMVLTEVWPPLRAALLNSTGWALFNGGASPPYNFITADNLSPFPAPIPGITHHYVNPSETLTLIENLSQVNASTVSISEAITRVDEFDLTPGDTVVQVNVSESVGVTESVTTKIGINLFETLAVGEGLTVST